MSTTIHARLRQQIEECYKESEVLPEPVQAVLATLEATVENAGLEKAASHPSNDTDIDALPDILFVIDDDGTILECRGGDPQDLAMPRDCLIGKSVGNCRFEDVGSRFASAMAESRITNQPVSMEYSLLCDNGLARFEARLLRSDDDRFLALVRNTTRQVEEESTGHRSSEEYRGLINSARVAEHHPSNSRSPAQQTARRLR